MEAALEENIDDNCTHNLEQMAAMLHYDFGVRLSLSTISKKLTGNLFTLKQVHVEPKPSIMKLIRPRERSF